MPHASNQVNWCLKKAEKEIEECKKQNKSLKHRGLTKVKPDIDDAKKHIAKAEHNLNAITYLDKGGYSDWSITAGFYCIYHCFLAIGKKFGYESRNQICTISLIEHLKEQGEIAINSKYIDMLKYDEIEERHESTVIEMREEYTYGLDLSADKTEIQKLIKNCKDMIDTTKEIVLK